MYNSFFYILISANDGEKGEKGLIGAPGPRVITFFLNFCNIYVLYFCIVLICTV